MRRIVATVAVMALLLAAMAAPAFAVANIKANCVGEAASIFNQDEPRRGRSVSLRGSARGRYWRVCFHQL